MTTCAHPRCSSPARWRCRDGQSRCSEHAVDVSPLTPLPDDRIFAARCPPGWRRDPLTGRPVMPCLGKLLFPCEPHEVPTHMEVQSQLRQLWDYTESLKPCWINLIAAVICDARYHKRNGRDGLAQDTEKYLADCIDEVLRFRGTVRIRRTAGGWEEVPDAAAAGE